MWGWGEAGICPKALLILKLPVDWTSDPLLLLGVLPVPGCVTLGRSLGSVLAHAMKSRPLASVVPESEFL